MPILPLPATSSTTTLVHGTLSSHLDCHNAPRVGPASALALLQHVLQGAAGVILSNLLRTLCSVLHLAAHHTRIDAEDLPLARRQLCYLALSDLHASFSSCSSSFPTLLSHPGLFAGMPSSLLPQGLCTCLSLFQEDHSSRLHCPVQQPLAPHGYFNLN